MTVAQAIYIIEAGGLMDGQIAKEKANFSHFEWVQNADRYDLKINNEHVHYMDVFDPDYLAPPAPADKRTLEALRISWFGSNHVDIEL